jgi:PAS domain S-box-containing protein
MNYDHLSGKHLAVKVVLTYAFFSSLWLLGSDKLLNLLSNDALVVTQLQTAKEWIFLFITSGLLYTLIQWSLRSLRKSYSLLYAVLEGTTDAIFVKDIQGRYITINSMAARLLGRPVEGIIGKDDTELLPPESAHQIQENDRLILSTGQPQSREEIVTINHNQRIFLSTKGVYRDLQGDVAGIVGIAHDITEQKRVQEQLAELVISEAIARQENEATQKRISHILDNTSDAFISLDSEWRYTYVNQKAGQLSHRRPEDLIGKNIWEEFPQGVGQTFYHAYCKALAQQEFIQLEVYYQPWDRWFENRIYPCKDGLSIFFQEITDQKRAELALVASERRYRSLVVATSQVVWVTDAVGQAIDYSPSWRELTGQSEEEVKGWGWISAIHPEDRERTAQLWSHAVETKSIYQSEHRVRTADGTYRFFLVRGIPILDENGEIQEWIGTHTDITERKLAEEALRQSKEQLHVFLDNSPAVIYQKDLDGRFILVNRRLENLVKLNRKQILGRTDYDIFPKELADIFGKNDRMVLAAQIPVESEEISPEEDGIHTYISLKFPLLDSAGVPYAVCGISTDITQRKRAEEALRQVKEELEIKVQERTAELQRLNEDLQRSNQELEQFAYVASHDLQEPLRAVGGYTQLLMQEYPADCLDESVREYMDYILDGATRMQQLIRDLLTYSRVGSRTQVFAPTDCNVVLQRTLENLQVAIAESKATITYDALPTITADKNQLVQLFQNLIGNAIKFCRDKVPQVHVTAELTDQAWRFEVRDNGIGIKPQYLDRIFVIFKRLHTRKEFSGTGIGLAICKKIVERHGGRIWVQSQLGVGTTFYFTLPLTPNSDQN